PESPRGRPTRVVFRWPPWRSVAISPAGDRLYLNSWGDGLYVWQLDGDRAQRLPAPTDQPVSALALSPDGSLLALGDRSGGVTLIGPDSSRQLLTDRSGPGAAITVLSFSPQGDLLAAGGQQGPLRLWTLAAATATAPADPIRLPGPRGEVRALAFDAHGRRLAVGGDDKVVEVWDLERIQDLLASMGLGWRPPGPGRPPSDQRL
ncbi:MAG: hypothetical protein IRY99_25055, partial [Isosphaeraceae bacterium]|nr:hypothetical protein [Isosphaeraceae bacterium]